MEDMDSLPAPDLVAAEIVENLKAALEAFQELQATLDSSSTEAIARKL